MRYTKKISKKEYILKNNKSAQEKNIIKLGQLEDILDKYCLKDAKSLDAYILELHSTIDDLRNNIEKYKKALELRLYEQKNKKSSGTSTFSID